MAPEPRLSKISAIDVENGMITKIEAASLDNPYPTGAKILNLTGKTVIPGLVGMHEHLFYTSPQAAQGRPTLGTAALWRMFRQLCKTSITSTIK